MPFISVLGSVLSFLMSSKVGFIFRVAMITAFIGVLVSFSVFFVGFLSDTYLLVKNAFNDVAAGISSSGGLSGISCLIHVLGIDDYLTSVFSLFFSAAAFWAVSIANIAFYKLSFKMYTVLIEV